MRRFFLTLPLFTLLGVLLFPLIYRLLPEQLFSGIVFYSGLAAASLIFIAFFSFACCSLLKHKSEKISDCAFPLSLLTASFISLSFNIIFLTVFPVTLDRSVSTYLLENIQSRGSTTAAELEAVFIKDYILERQAVLRRLEEQEFTGNIIVSPAESETSATIKLSSQGQRFLAFGDLIRFIFRLKDRRINSQPAQDKGAE